MPIILNKMGVCGCASMLSKLPNIKRNWVPPEDTSIQMCKLATALFGDFSLFSANQNHSFSSLAFPTKFSLHSKNKFVS